MAGNRMMSLKALAVCLAVAGTTLFSLQGAMAQSSSCTNTLVSLSPCLDFITGNATKPTKSCCTQLGNVVSSQPQCLCQVIGGGGSNSLGININQTQALALPAQCNVQTPPASRCSNAASPSGSPNAPTGTGGGSGTSTDGTSSSDGNNAKLTLTLLFVGIFLASYSSVFPATAAV
ncbi:unnamed protein product [Linum trigynum]|uniref:Bifunctional inhibitor/plant lipid transfer protein/seed storage helical domain-containing protein n=1 Tax=Linum trigynum TaxID=586398 RepID=A0AAV2EAL2_9ROSI